jgi:hypothetical protein
VARRGEPPFTTERKVTFTLVPLYSGIVLIPRPHYPGRKEYEVLSISMKKRRWRRPGLIKYIILRAWYKCRYLCRCLIDGVLLALPLRARISLDFFRHHGKFQRLASPRTFSEKIAHRKLFDRDPRMPFLSDKILVKQHVMEVLGQSG